MQNRPATLETPRLLLVALLAQELRALVSGDVALAGELAGVGFPPAWPDEREARKGLPWHLRYLEQDDHQRPWRVRVIVLRPKREVVGAMSLKGPPNDRGDVEISWGVQQAVR